ncbi:MAG: glycosyltransferase family 10 domain-containing protein [Limisphaerales bacterium]
MRRIFIDFVDFPGLAREQNPFLPLLHRRFELVSSEYPDYLVFTHEGHRHKLYSCTKIFYTQENYLANWRQCDYAILSIKVNDPRAFHLPVYSLWCNAADLVRPAAIACDELLASKISFCAFLTGYVDSTVRLRTRFFHKLNARKRVDSAGTALNNTGYNVRDREQRRAWLSRYKFYMAFENSSVPGWITERIIDAFAAHTVPIYWGDPTVKQQFNPAAFIDRRDFPSDEACIEYILKVDADDELYRRYLAAPPFHQNRPNKEWDHERLLDFFERVVSARPDPVARRRWFWPLIKWRLVKRIKTHEEKGTATAEQRHAEWLRETGETPRA